MSVYGLVKGFAQVAVHLFYKVRMSDDNIGALAQPGPVIYIANHPNGLIDPGVLMALVGRDVTFLGKEPLFRMPIIGPLAKGMGAIPVYRRQDSGPQASQGNNDTSLDAAAQALAKGAAISIFPEGISHSFPSVQAMKTGCARLAVKAIKLGVKPVIVPLGLTYESRAKFRSELGVEVGDPINAAGTWLAAAENEETTVRALTEELGEALRKVTVNLEQWDDLPLVTTAEALLSLDAGQEPGRSDRFRLVADAARKLRQESPAEFESIKNDIALFNEKIGLLNVDAGKLQTSYNSKEVALFAVRHVLWFAVATPLAVVGWLLWKPLLLLPKFINKKNEAEPDLHATATILITGALAIPWMFLASWVVGELSDSFMNGLSTLLAMPFLGLAAMATFERRKEATAAINTFLKVVRKSPIKAELVAESKALVARLRGMANGPIGTTPSGVKHPAQVSLETSASGQRPIDGRQPTGAHRGPVPPNDVAPWLRKK